MSSSVKSWHNGKSVVRCAQRSVRIATESCTGNRSQGNATCAVLRALCAWALLANQTRNLVADSYAKIVASDNVPRVAVFRFIPSRICICVLCVQCRLAVAVFFLGPARCAQSMRFSTDMMLWTQSFRALRNAKSELSDPVMFLVCGEAFLRCALGMHSLCAFSN